MRIKSAVPVRIALLLVVIAGAALLSGRLRADTGTCGGASITLPFTDVLNTNVFFCSIAEAYFSGLTNGTTSTTYNPGDSVPREQMAAFTTRTMDQSLKRGSRRAALNQYWTTQSEVNLGLTAVGAFPQQVQSDGADLWVANNVSSGVSRVRASDGKLLDVWSGATAAVGVLCAMGKVFVTGDTIPGSLFQINPTQPPGAVTTVSTALGASPNGIAYDGQKIWTANKGGGEIGTGSVSIITLNPVSVTTVSGQFGSPFGAIYDGANIWITDKQGGPVDKLHKLDASGAIALTVSVGAGPGYPAFDGTNIWVPHLGSTVTVVRATGSLTGTVLATLSGNGLNGSYSAAFDGERILVTNLQGSSVSLWKAADFTPIGNFSTGASTDPVGACSDGVNFWITLGSGNLARF
jgi:hypothetical protein